MIKSTPQILSNNRIVSIDIFRAITMFLMVFVNDFSTITNVPHWLQHAKFGEDMLGFSDIIFPCFMFIIGMSIPFSIEARLAKNESIFSIIKHTFVRSISLIIMGLFIVNTDNGVSQQVALSKSIFTILFVIGIFLTWNIYPKANTHLSKNLRLFLPILGILLLSILAFIYKDEQELNFRLHWLGILGLLGLTFFLCAVIYLFFRQKMALLVGSFLILLLFTLTGLPIKTGFLGNIFNYLIPANGGFQSFTMAGMLLSILFFSLKVKISLKYKYIIAFSGAILFSIAGYFSHHFWIISKLNATPPWIFFCIAISIVVYLIIFYIAEIKDFSHCFDLIKPAGTATLTCYIVPYFLYSIIEIFNITLPNFATTSPIGLIKCVIFSCLTICVTALLLKIGVKLKI